MKSVPSQVAREVEITVPAFARAVQVKNADHLMTTLDAFVDDPDLLYKCIWYAISHGKAVKFLPSRESLDRSEREATYDDHAL